MSQHLEKKIKVLIVEDSRSVQDLLKYILESDPNIEVIGIAENGKIALEQIRRARPDVITMDMDMPVMNGLETTKAIMETDPIPIIIVTASWSPSDVRKTYDALDAGAVSILCKPQGIGHPEHQALTKELNRTIRVMSQIKLVKRRPKKCSSKIEPTGKVLPWVSSKIELLVMGASTGGPAVYQYILSNLPKDLPFPILMVQHISKGFLDGFVNWLILSTKQSIHIAANNEKTIPGHFYIAPEDRHLGMHPDGTILLARNKDSLHCPSASFLFTSAAESYGSKAIGIILTGMGRDGASELKLMRNSGAITIAQDKESSIIYGMPMVAKDIGAAEFILSPEEIIKTLSSCKQISS